MNVYLKMNARGLKKFISDFGDKSKRKIFYRYKNQIDSFYKGNSNLNF